VEGTFIVPKEYENRVRIGDEIVSEYDNIPLKQNAKRAPLMVYTFDSITEKRVIFLHASLQLYKNNTWQSVEKFERTIDYPPEYVHDKGGTHFLYWT
jgi:hypothetical protein